MQPQIGDELPEGTRAWVVLDGKIGDEIPMSNPRSMGSENPSVALLRAKNLRLGHAWGPIDPCEGHDRRRQPARRAFTARYRHRRGPPQCSLPALLEASIAAGNLHNLCRDPHCRSHGADLIWVPAHDRLRGPNVIATLTPANRLPKQAIEQARSHPDPRVAGLPHPRVAIIIGGTSNHHSFGAKEERELAEISGALARDGASVMVTPSRRTPPGLVSAIDSALGDGEDLRRRSFVCRTGEGENPYVAMLANASAIIVTADSVNMVGEAVATGAPVHVYEPTGGHPKITAYIDSLVALGAVRRWRGQLEDLDLCADQRDAGDRRGIGAQISRISRQEQLKRAASVVLAHRSIAAPPRNDRGAQKDTRDRTDKPGEQSGSSVKGAQRGRSMAADAGPNPPLREIKQRSEDDQEEDHPKAHLLAIMELGFGCPIEKGRDILRILLNRLRRPVGISTAPSLSGFGMAILWPGKYSFQFGSSGCV